MVDREKKVACEEFGALLIESAERGAPSESERWALERHAHECPACWMELMALDQLGQANSDMPSGSVRLPSGKVLDELNRRRVINALVDERSVGKTVINWPRLAVWAGAACSLVALATFLVFAIMGGGPGLETSRVLMASKEIRVPGGRLAVGSPVPPEEMRVQGEAVLKMDSGIHVLLKADTRVQASRDGSDIRLKLVEGTAFARVEPGQANSRLVFDTPQGTVEVTGTVLSVSAGREARVRVWRGTVLVRAPDKKPLAVKATQQAVVGSDQASRMSTRQLNLAWRYISKMDLLAAEETAKVVIHTRPAGALVTVDDVPLGRTPLSMIIGAGRRELRISKAGHSRITEQLRIQAGEPVERVYKLSPRRGKPKQPVPEPEKTANLEKPAPPKIDLGQDSDADDLSRRALGLRIKKKYDESYQTYTKLLKHFPDTRAGRGALISRGMLFLEVFNRPHLALADFNAYLKNNPKGILAPEAAFGQALVFRQLKKRAAEKRILRRIIKDYPATQQANKARDRLRQMRKKKRATGRRRGSRSRR